MKFVTVLVAAFCLSVASAASLPKPGINDPILVNIKVLEAQFENAINAVLKVYIVNAQKSLQLPITSEELKGHQYIEYTNPPIDNSANPHWNLTYGFPSAFFNLDSYITVEIWNQETANVLEFICGAELTVRNLEAFQNTFNLALFDKQNQYAGWSLIDYQIPA